MITRLASEIHLNGFTRSKEKNGLRGFTLDFDGGDRDFWYSLITNGLRDRQEKEAKDAGEEPDTFIGSNPDFEPDKDLGQRKKQGAENLPENQRGKSYSLYFPDDGSAIDAHRLLKAFVLKEFTYGDLFFDALEKIVGEAESQRVTLLMPKRMNIRVVGDQRAVDIHVSANWYAKLYRIYAKEKDRQVEAEDIWRKITENNEFSRIARGAAKGAGNVVMGWAKIISDPIGTAEALANMALHPEQTYEGLKKALGDKWEEFQNANYYDRIEIVSELSAEIIIEILLTKGAAKVAKTGIEIARVAEIPVLTKGVVAVDNFVVKTAEVSKGVVTKVAEVAVVGGEKAAEGLLRLKDAIIELLKKFELAERAGKKLTAEALKIRDQLLAAKTMIEDAIANGKTLVKDVLPPETIRAFTAVADQIINPTVQTLKSVPPAAKRQLEKIAQRNKLIELRLNKKNAVRAVKDAAEDLDNSGPSVIAGVPEDAVPNPKVYRVQGGTLPKASMERITIGKSGEMVVIGEGRLYVTFDDLKRVRVFLKENRPDGEIISFEVSPQFAAEVRKAAIPQELGKKFPHLPQEADISRTKNSFGLSDEWIKKLEKATISGTGKIEK
jgi:hypothetical protein